MSILRLMHEPAARGFSIIIYAFERMKVAV